MIGRDIIFPSAPVRDKSTDKKSVFYINELLYSEKLKPPKSPVQMGMAKIQASTPLGKYGVDLCTSLTVHGFNHITAPRRHIVERYN